MPRASGDDDILAVRRRHGDEVALGTDLLDDGGHFKRGRGDVLRVDGDDAFVRGEPQPPIFLAGKSRLARAAEKVGCQAVAAIEKAILQPLGPTLEYRVEAGARGAQEATLRGEPDIGFLQHNRPDGTERQTLLGGVKEHLPVRNAGEPLAPYGDPQHAAFVACDRKQSAAQRTAVKRGENTALHG